MYNNRKSFIIKLLVVACIIYLCIHVLTNNAAPVIRELQESGRNLAALDGGNLEQAALTQENEMKEAVPIAEPTKAPEKPSEKVVTTEEPKKEPTVLEKVKELSQCLDKPMVPKTQQRGDYWVLYNYITAEKTFKCHESITYTTHADYSFMDNLVPLLERWKGPVSIAMHAPGTDFSNTLESIAHLRDCTTSLVKEYVTFHIYFSTKHVPKE
ncbi:hypothetical protein NQ314_013974, partial [Rhamnusium bicolor]